MDEKRMKHTEEEYINAGFYDGDMDVDIQNHKIKVVKCRKPHQCTGGCGTEIKAGDYALLETGFMDGEPVTCHTCLPCIDEWLDKLKGLEEDGWSAEGDQVAGRHRETE